MSRRHLASFALAALLAACGRSHEPQCGGVEPFEAKPVSHLAAEWRLPGARPLAMAERLFLQKPGGRSVEVDPRSGGIVRDLERSSVFSWMPEGSGGDLWIGHDDTPWVTAVDPVSLAERWKARCNPGPYRCAVHGARAGSVAVFGGVIEFDNPKASLGAFGINTHTGEELWRTEPFSGDSMGLRVAADGEYAFLLDAAALRAYSAVTGQPLWTRALTQPLVPMRARILAAENHIVAYWDGGDSGRIVTLDADTGDDLAIIPWGRMAGDVILEGEIAYVASLWDGKGMDVGAFYARTGQEKWRAHSEDRWIVPPIALAEDAVFILRAADSNDALNDRGSEILALDRETGQPGFVHPVGQIDSFALVRWAPGGSVLAFEAPTGEVIGMRRGDAPPAPIEVTLSGHLVSKIEEPLDLHGLRVDVGGAVATTNADGAFSARVRALGALRVRLLDIPTPKAPPPLRAAPVLFYVGGAAAPSAVPGPFADPAQQRLPDGSQPLEATIAIERVAPWPRD